MNELIEIPARLSAHRRDGVTCEQIAAPPRRDRLMEWAIGILTGVFIGAGLAWFIG